MTSSFKLTPHFRVGEFAVSADHPELVEPVPDHLGDRLVRLAVHVLEPPRVAADREFTILSGYRPVALNRAVRGEPTSQHTRAEAADFTCDDVRDVWLRMLGAEIRIDRHHLGQVIYYPAKNFVHAALPSVRYPHPTFCIHWPARHYSYAVVRDVAHALDLLEVGR